MIVGLVICLVAPVLAVLPVALGLWLSDRESKKFWLVHQGLAELDRMLSK